MKTVTMRDIAKELNISVVSVSNALADKGGVSDDVRKKVLELSDKLGYRNNQSKAKQPDLNDAVGIVIAERYLFKYESFYMELYNQLSKKLMNSGYFGILESLPIELEKTLSPPKILTATTVKGIIVLGQIKQEYLDLLKSSELPIVLLDFYNEHSYYDAITTDNFYSSYLLTNYLISQGHKKIAFVGNIQATSSILDRYLGYCKALIEHMLPLNGDWLISDRDENGVFIELTLAEPAPTAYVCNCDEIAYKMVERLKSLGRKIPEDASIVGFDNYIYSTLSSPQITTVKFNTDAMTSSCIKEMLKKIQNPYYSFGRKIIMGEIVYRDSVCAIGNES